MLKKLLTAFVVLTSCGFSAHGQARPTADRLGDLQAGVSYSTTNSDYVPNRVRGFGFYADFDFKSHYGIDLTFHQNDDPQTILYERSYEVGGRYVLHPHRFDRIAPYVRASYGRGVFNFLPDCRSKLFPYLPVACNDPNVDPTTTAAAANLAYNMFVGAGGVDIKIIPRINVRAEYEYQHWVSFPPNGLTPMMFTVGVAYHFPAGKPIYGKSIR